MVVMDEKSTEKDKFYRMARLWLFVVHGLTISVCVIILMALLCTVPSISNFEDNKQETNLIYIITKPSPEKTRLITSLRVSCLHFTAGLLMEMLAVVSLMQESIVSTFVYVTLASLAAIIYLLFDHIITAGIYLAFALPMAMFIRLVWIRNM